VVLVILTRDHSLLQMQKLEPSHNNLPISVEFLSFWGILRNSVLAGDQEIHAAYFRLVQAAVENYLLHVDMIAPPNT